MGFRRALQRNFSASAIRSPGCRDPSPPEKVQQNRLRLASDESSGHSTQRRWVFAALSKETSSLGLLVSVESSGHSTNGDGFSPRSPKKLLRVSCAGSSYCRSSSSWEGAAEFNNPSNPGSLA